MRKSEIRNPKSKIIRPILWAAGAITAAVVLGALLMGVARGVVPTTSDAERFACNGTTTAFVFHFGIWNTSEAEVQKVTNATGAASVLTEASDYTVTLPNDDGWLTPGGTVTTATAYSSAYTLVIARLPILEQQSDYSTAESVDLESIEDDFDKAAIRDRYLQRLIRRSLRTASTDLTDVNLGTAAERASSTFTWDANGSPAMVAGLVSPNDVTVSALWKIVVGEANLADTLASLGLGTPAGNVTLRSLYHRGIYNVIDYGADGNGVTDDSTAIQEALDAADDAGGGIVLVPAGTYRATNLHLYSHTTLLGDGGATIKMSANSTTNLLTALTETDVRIQGLTFDLNGVNQTAPTYNASAVGVVIRNVSRAWIKDCRFTGCYYIYLLLYLSDNVWVDNCSFDGAMPTPPGAAWLCDDIEVQGCTYITVQSCRMIHTAPSSPDYGIGAVWTSNSSYVTIEDNTAVNCGRGSGSSHQVGAIDFYDNVHSMTIRNNRLEQCQQWGVRLKCTTPSSVLRVLDNDINVPDAVGWSPIWVVRTSAAIGNIWIENNHIEGPEDVAGSQVAGIRIQEAGTAGDEPNKLWIRGNDIAAGEYGILMEGASDFILSGNRIRVQSYGIDTAAGAANACQRGQVIDNRIDASRNTASHAMVVAGTDMTVAGNIIQDAYNGIVASSFHSGTIRANSIEASHYHLMLYNTTGDTSPILVEQNIFAGAGAAYYQQGAQSVHYRLNSGDTSSATWVSTDKFYADVIVRKTLDLDDDASTDDYQFDDDAANTTKQTITLTNILPANASLVSWQIRCLEGVADANTFTVDLGTSSGGTQLYTGLVDDTSEIAGPAAGSAPILAATNAARSLYLGGTPSADWSIMHSTGRWAIFIKYTDYAAVNTQDIP